MSMGAAYARDVPTALDDGVGDGVKKGRPDVAREGAAEGAEGRGLNS